MNLAKNSASSGTVGKAKVSLLILAVGLQGCLGGSGEDSVDSGPEFIDWSGNDNGSIIQDFDDERFAVAGDRKIYYIESSDLYIRIDNTQVGEGGVVFVDGSQVGAIQLLTSNAGGSVAYFVWFNGNNPYLIDVQRLQHSIFSFNQTSAPASLANGQSDTGGSTFQSAVTIGDSSMISGTVNSTSNTEDFYTFTAASSAHYQVLLNFSQYVDLDLFLYDDNYQVIGSSEGVTGGQELIGVSLTGNRRYYIRVLAYDVSSQSDNTANYDLQVSR